jgi:hypothetical protein
LWDLRFHQWHTSPSECSHCSQHGSIHVYTCSIQMFVTSAAIIAVLYSLEE